MDKNELAQIAKECGFCGVDDHISVFEKFAQRIEQPLRAEIEQLRKALMHCKGFVDAYGEPETKYIVRKALEGK